MEFQYAAELKKHFTCYGHFYELGLMNGDRVKCRSVLEIVDETVPQDDPSAISERAPDVVVIMMNPGSSRPKVEGVVEPVIEYAAGQPFRRKALVLTQPDNTQYQVMRVALAKGWSHIRVLNLSDLRDPKSTSFLRRAAALEEIMGGHAHSLFREERAAELERSLERDPRTPILLGWGQDPGLLPMVERCLELIAGEPTVTVPSDIHPLLSAHPSPMLQKKKLEWLDSILSALNAM